MRARAELALAFTTLIWGSTFVLVKQALDDISTLLFLTLRFSLAFLALLLLHRRAWSAERDLRRSARAGAVTGIFLFSGYTFQTLGLRWTTASKSAFITGFSIPMVPLLAALVYKNRPRLLELMGVLLATVGMALMTLEAGRWTVGRGDLLTLACAVAFAAQVVAVGHYAPQASVKVLTTSQVITAAVLSGGSFWWVETPFVRWRTAVLLATGVTGLFATALAFSLQAWAQQYTSATRAALIFGLEPVFGWLTSFALAGETLSGRVALGAGLILCGILLVELKPFHRQQHPSD